MLFSIILVLFFLVAAYLVRNYVRYLLLKDEFPMPKRSWNFFAGHLLSFRKARQEYRLAEWRRELFLEGGEVFQFFKPLAADRSVVLNDPDWVEYVLMTKNMPKSSPNYKMLQFIGGNGLVTNMDHEHWQFVRKQLAHAFSPTSIKGNMPILEGLMARFMAKIDANQDKFLDYDNELVLVTFDFIGESAFGIAFNALEDKEGDSGRFLALMRESVEETLWYLAFPPLKYIRWSAYQGTQAKIREIRRICHKFMNEASVSEKDEAKARVTAIWDVLAHMKEIDEEERLDNFITFLFAGHDTTAHSTAYLLYNLVIHPESMAKVVAEVDSVLGSEVIANTNHIAQLNYLMQCAKESLRIIPTVGGTVRVMNETKTINGWTLKEGTTIQTSTHMMHFYEKYWPSPFKFDPDRFSKENEASRPKGCYMPFSLGPRDCIGKTMALNEELICVATLLKNYTFELPKDFKLLVNVGLINKPEGGIPLKATKRVH